jgi:Mrp family chromosome partitioning ATPase/capsular polysaccharide biosynthesis protein
MITKMAAYTSYDMLGSLTKVLAGRPVIEKVVYELGLADENTPPEELNQIISRIQGAVNAVNEMGTNIVNIAVEYGDPEMTAKIANTIAKVYIQIDAEEKNERARNVRVFLEEQLAKSKERLSKAEDKLKSFKEEGGATGLAVRIENNIAGLEIEKTRLKKIYTENYPDIIKINEEILDLKEQLRTLPVSELEYARLMRELQVNERSYQLIQSKFEEARIVEAEKVEDIKLVDTASVPGSPIRPNKRLAILIALVIGLVVGIFMSFVVETLDTSIGTIDDLETLLHLPVLAVIPYMKFEMDKGEKDKHWSSRFLKRVPLFLKRKTSEDNVSRMLQQVLIKHDQRSSVTEAYRILRTNIKIEELLQTNKRILVITSTIPKEGKSITALNLSLALAQDGYKTLLVDCDLRKATLHKVFKIDKQPGISDILLGTVRQDAAIRNFIDIMMADSDINTEDVLKIPGLDNFNLLPCGRVVSNPAELLDSKAVGTFFSNLKTRYDFVVIDTPPVLPVPDTIILGTKVAEKIYLVYRSGFTSKLAVLRVKDQLDMMKAMLNGIILNSTTPESQIVSDYYHHYYHHYRYYTNKKQEGEDEKKM